MFLVKRSVIVAKSAIVSSFLTVNKNENIILKSVSVRCVSFTKILCDLEKLNKKEREPDFIELKDVDDPNFQKNLILALQNPKKGLTRGSINLVNEFKKFYYEMKEKGQTNYNFELDNKTNKVEILFKFETEEDLRKFEINTDSSFNSGYSSGSLKLSQQETAIFSGYIETKVPKDGELKWAGFANMLSKKQKLAFLRRKTFDWSQYTHLVLKVRGDGRRYLIIANKDLGYERLRHIQYGQVLYTRGGPYWQIAKLPLSHFFLMNQGKTTFAQDEKVEFKGIHSFGITAGVIKGPFKLEIDYIGLEYDEHHNDTSPYENYYSV